MLQISESKNIIKADYIQISQQTLKVKIFSVVKYFGIKSTIKI